VLANINFMAGRIWPASHSLYQDCANSPQSQPKYPKAEQQFNEMSYKKVMLGCLKGAGFLRLKEVYRCIFI